MLSIMSLFSICEFTFPFLSNWKHRLYSGKIILNTHVPKVKDILNLRRSRRMFIFENFIIMYSSPIMACFVQYSTLTVYHILCLDSMFLLFARVVAFSLSLVLWSWDLLFGRVYESLETGKVLFHFIYSSKP